MTRIKKITKFVIILSILFVALLCVHLPALFFSAPSMTEDMNSACHYIENSNSILDYITTDRIEKNTIELKSTTEKLSFASLLLLYGGLLFLFAHFVASHLKRFTNVASRPFAQILYAIVVYLHLIDGKKDPGNFGFSLSSI